MSEAADRDPVAFDPQPRRPAWGVQVPRRKSQSTRGPILDAPPPARVTIPLAQPPLPAARPVVVPGQHVLCGEPVAEPGAPGLPRVHASIEGTVTAVGAAAVAGSPGRVRCVTIAGSGGDRRWPGYAPVAAPARLEPGELRDRIALAGIAGLGGAAFPTGRKLGMCAGAGLLLVNGVECEPYISCDDLLLRERADRVVAGTRLLLEAVGARRGVIAVKTGMTEARVALVRALEAAGDSRLALSVVTGRYPAGGERQLIELVTGREVPAGGHPADVGVVCQNVGTAAAVADFFDRGQPLLSRIVTVTGGGVASPQNIEARIGTPVADLVALAGGYRDQPRRLIMGGPMMGIALPDDALPVTAATNCLIVATAAELGTDPAVDAAVEMPCIRCGACIEACPANLLPQELLAAARAGDGAGLGTLGLAECIECGTCDYVCPSRIPLTREFAAAKRARAERETGSDSDPGAGG
jgi:electron transport complex protein RnfC